MLKVQVYGTKMLYTFIKVVKKLVGILIQREHKPSCISLEIKKKSIFTNYTFLIFSSQFKVYSLLEHKTAV